jgi:hypothetical protein
MYLITTVNALECGWEIVTKGNRKECEKAQADLTYKVWHNADGTQKMFSDIYDDTRAKNSRILTKHETQKLFCGKRKLELTEELMLNHPDEA